MTVVLRSKRLACLYNTTKNMFHEGAIDVVLRSIPSHVAIVLNTSSRQY